MCRQVPSGDAVVFRGGLVAVAMWRDLANVPR
jgi:hypothetical protein